MSIVKNDYRSLIDMLKQLYPGQVNFDYKSVSKYKTHYPEQEVLKYDTLLNLKYLDILTSEWFTLMETFYLLRPEAIKTAQKTIFNGTQPVIATEDDEDIYSLYDEIVSGAGALEMAYAAFKRKDPFIMADTESLFYDAGHLIYLLIELLKIMDVKLDPENGTIPVPG